MQLSTKTLIALLPYFLQASALASGSGTTTRYWDCCKPSCSWPGKTALAAGSNPVTTCDIHDNPLTDYNAVSGCDGGSAYMSSKESPWAVTDDLAYGYAAVNIAGGSESSWCCACYELTFTSGPVAGKKMIVQATNTGGDLGSNQFDISIPGGGVGIFNGCTTEWGAPSSGWGAQYGGISSNTCSTFPEALQAGCNWRFDWFQNANNPTVDFTQVACPAAITKNSGCTRADDTSAPAAAAPSGSAVAAVASSSTSTPVAIKSTSSAQAASVATSSKAAVVVAGTSSAKAVVASSSSAPAVVVSTSTPSPIKATTSSTSAKATGSSTHSTSSSTLSKSSTSSTRSASSTPAASAGTLQKYYQCGGLGWSGSGSCVAGSTCVVQNAWYSQCL